ncbi:hypothetical protein [Streptomyces sp. B1I3]|uniref:hypothetical protein n=1 Tax=Streptomyces sp. B1I3 TaxID=3042264 RepID=UPI0027875B37|nr:hypothetical protein [Streptomyces sp. B1I3]MDQ0792937.1 hypothetical protein [Streptomyces sp. B1I3]
MEREAQRPVRADCGQKFTDDRWAAVDSRDWSRLRPSHPDLCEDVMRNFLYEITAARYEKLCTRLRELQLGAVADLGFVGLEDGAGE